MFPSTLREEAETELQDFLDQIGPANRHISLRDYGKQGFERNTAGNNTKTSRADMCLFSSA